MLDKWCPLNTGCSRQRRGEAGRVVPVDEVAEGTEGVSQGPRHGQAHGVPAVPHHEEALQRLHGPEGQDLARPAPPRARQARGRAGQERLRADRLDLRQRLVDFDCMLLIMFGLHLNYVDCMFETFKLSA